MSVGKETSIAFSLEGFTSNNSTHDDSEPSSLINSISFKRFLPESPLSIISGSRGRRRFSRRRH